MLKVHPTMILRGIADGDDYATIGQNLNCSPTTIGNAVRRLAIEGYMDATPTGNMMRYTINDRGRAVAKGEERLEWSIRPSKEVKIDAPPDLPPELLTQRLTTPVGFKVKVPKSNLMRNGHPVYLDFGRITLARFTTHTSAVMAANAIAPAIRSLSSVKFKSTFISALELYDGLAVGVRV